MCDSQIGTDVGFVAVEGMLCKGYRRHRRMIIACVSGFGGGSSRKDGGIDDVIVGPCLHLHSTRNFLS